MSTWGKVLFFMVILLIVASYFKSQRMAGEGFESSGFSQKSGSEIYDEFYAGIYDFLVYNTTKNNYEIGNIMKETELTEESRVLDIGSGTGHHVGELSEKGYNVIGLDNSSAMVQKAQATYPKAEFIQGDVLDSMAFQYGTFTHILCMYFTIYYIKDKTTFFHNCYNWLQPMGVLVVHIVDRDHFDPILPPGNPLLMLTPQRYAKERITQTNVTFDDFKYNANFELNEKTGEAKFIEKFKNKETEKTFRKQEHTMYMESESDILDMAKQVGFIVEGKIDLIKATYEYQYLYIFKKPN